MDDAACFSARPAWVVAVRFWLALLLFGLIFFTGCSAAETINSGQTEVDTLKGQDPAAQLQAARRITAAQWVPPDAVQPLLALLKSDDAKLRRAAADALACLDAKTGRSITPAILEVQKTERDPGVRAVLEQSIERFHKPG